jgi:Succinylglutamate desuccinylase / Aspartoacylase family
LDVVSLILRNPHLRQKIELVLLPTLNYQGLVANTRNRIDGSDLNRSFSEESGDGAIADIKKAIGDKPFDVALDLHGANRRKHFFVIKSDSGDTLAARALTAFDSTLLLRADNGEATGAVGAMTTGVFDPNRYWLEAPGLSISTNAGTLKSYAYALGTPHSYTVEYPGSLDLTLAREKNLELVLGLIAEALRQK